MTLTAAPSCWPRPLLAPASPTRAQRPPRVARVGILSASVAPLSGERWPVHRIFVERLRDLGWIEGVNLQLEFRHGQGTAAGIAAAAAELVALQPDVLLGAGTPAIRALLTATRTVPIVMPASSIRWPPARRQPGAPRRQPHRRVVARAGDRPEGAGAAARAAAEGAPHRPGGQRHEPEQRLLRANLGRRGARRGHRRADGDRAARRGHRVHDRRHRAMRSRAARTGVQPGARAAACRGRGPAAAGGQHAGPGLRRGGQPDEHSQLDACFARTRRTSISTGAVPTRPKRRSSSRRATN